MKLKLLVGIVLFVFVAGLCSEGTAAEDGPEVLEIKGLYLGMELDEGFVVLKKLISPRIAEKLGEGKPLEITRIPPYEECGYGLGYFPPGCAQVLLQADCSEKKRVFHIFFPKDFANEIFDAKKMTQEEYVRLIESRYGIEMKAKAGEDASSASSDKTWEFNSPYGYRIFIDSDRSILVERVDQKEK